MTLNNHLQQQYEIEQCFADKIRLSAPGSPERRKLFKQAYTKVTSHIQMNQSTEASLDYGGGDYLVNVLMGLHLNGKHFLDIGCGTGSLCVAMAQKGFISVGIDTSEDCIFRAKQRAFDQYVQCSFFQHDLFDGDLTLENFDLIVNDNVLEHICPDETEEFINRCKTMLNSNGLLITLTPNRLIGPYDISGKFLPRGSVARGLHLREYSFTELNDIMVRAGFVRIRSLPVASHMSTKIGLTSANIIWCYKSILMERLMTIIPPQFRLPRLFRLLVSDIIIAQKL